MSWYDLIGTACIVTGVCAIPFLFSLRVVSRGRLPGWNFTLVGLTSVLYWCAGVGIIAREEWRFYPLIPALILTGVIWLMGSKIHFRIANRYDEK